MLKRIITFLKLKRADFLWFIFNMFFEMDYDSDEIFLKSPYRLTIEEPKQNEEDILKKERDITISYEDEEASNFEVLNLDTGEYIPRCIYANQRTGDYEIQIYDIFDNFVGTELRNGNIVLVYKGE